MLLTEKNSFLKTASYLMVSCLFCAFALSPAYADELLSSAGKSLSSKSSSKLLEKLQPLPVQEDDGITPTNKKPITVYEDEEEEGVNKDARAMIYLTIATPHGKDSRFKVVAYPYPPKPPKTEDYGPLPTKDKEIREFLINSGYTNRRSKENPFPSGGWRFKYAINKAKQKSHMSVPHSIFEYRGWTKKMVQFVKPEILKINAFEEERKENWEKYKTFQIDHYKLMKSKSARFGLEKVYFKPLPKERNKIGNNFGVVLPEGKWWIFAEKKSKGLKCYWVKELDLKDKDRLVLVFNEANASVITGSW